MLSKLTLIGMHNYTKGAIWDDIMLPAGIDKDVLCNEILKQCGEFPLIYPDDEFLKAQIQMFFKKWYHNFERWYAVYTEEYNALYNVDVTSNITEHGINEEESASSGNAATTSSRNGSGTSSGNNSGSENRSKAAYDASTLQPTEGTSTSGTTSLSSSETASESGSSSSSESMTASQEHTITTDERKYGNQGVTMSQEMLLAEFNAWRFNLYSQIADIFASEFCVCIYV